MKTLYKAGLKIANKIDQHFGTNVKEKGGRVYRLFLKGLSPIRRKLDPLGIRLLYKIRSAPPQNLRLHLGCGWKRFEGYTNVDLWITDATDVICYITDLPWPDNSASVIESHHVIEHISHRKIRSTLAEWHRVLIPDGRLILECPDFDRAVQEYLNGNEERLLNIFGRQRSDGDAHLFGYNTKRLIRLLREAGFNKLVETEPRSSQKLDEPCIRVECRKSLQ